MLSKRANPIATNKQQMTALDYYATPSLFTPKFFLPSSPKTTSTSSSDSDNIAMSPTFIPETTRSSSPRNIVTNHVRSLFHKKSTTDQSNHHPHPVGLGLVDILKDENIDTTKKTPNPERTNAMLVMSTKHKIQIHPMQSYSPVEFGIKNKSSQLASLDADMLPFSPRHGVQIQCLSPRDMESSEDYTRIIARGPNPRTTHIFDNCVIENCDGFPMDPASYGSGDFLRFCHACKKELLPWKDIFMYRGEIAFCSSECRYQQMLFDEEMEY